MYIIPFLYIVVVYLILLSKKSSAYMLRRFKIGFNIASLKLFIRKIPNNKPYNPSDARQDLQKTKGGSDRDGGK